MTGQIHFLERVLKNSRWWKYFKTRVKFIVTQHLQKNVELLKNFAFKHINT
jgi:hypothetical protein